MIVEVRLIKLKTEIEFPKTCLLSNYWAFESVRLTLNS